MAYRSPEVGPSGIPCDLHTPVGEGPRMIWLSSKTRVDVAGIRAEWAFRVGFLQVDIPTRKDRPIDITCVIDSM